MRTVNLVVEVFIDVADDGTAYAEALMLRDVDKLLVAQGFARLEPQAPGADPANDGQIAAHALVDLAETLMDDLNGQHGENRAPPLRTG